MGANRPTPAGACGAVLLCIAGVVWASAPAPPAMREPPFEIRHGPGDEAVARRTLLILRDAAREFSDKLPLGDAAVNVFICGTFDEFRNLAGAYGRRHIGGMADSDAGRIVLKGPRLLKAGSDYEGMVRHELIHVLLARNTGPDNMPRWFNEGVAMLLSRELRWGGPMRVARMYVYRDLIPYWQLNFAFAPRGDETVFGNAYAQAESMTRFLRDRIGDARFWALVLALKTNHFDAALWQFAGLTPGGLFQAWRQSLWQLAVMLSVVTGMAAFQVMALLVILAFVRKYRRGKRILRQWDEEDANQDPDSDDVW